MTTFPGSPRLTKGAIIAMDLAKLPTSVIIFQYNPNSLTRTLEAQMPQAGAARSEVMRVSGPPSEKISISELEIDATDQLEQAQATAVAMGISPQLSALEMLLYPQSSLIIANTALLAAGTIEIIPPEAPFVLFVWGLKRVLPVRLTTFTITEEAYDPNLNPIRAKVSLSMDVLTYEDFPVDHPGHSLYLAHQVVKEAMAIVGSVSNAGAVAGGNISLL